MPDFAIDKETGDVLFPDGLVLTSSLTEDTLSTLSRPAKPYQLSAIPFCWYTMEIGTLGEFPYRVELCFFENNIVHLDLHIDDDKVLDYTNLEAFQTVHERIRGGETHRTTCFVKLWASRTTRKGRSATPVGMSFDFRIATLGAR